METITIRKIVDGMEETASSSMENILIATLIIHIIWETENEMEVTTIQKNVNGMEK